MFFFIKPKKSYATDFRQIRYELLTTLEQRLIFIYQTVSEVKDLRECEMGNIDKD